MKYVDAATTAEKISDKFNIPMAELVDMFTEIPAAMVISPRINGKTYYQLRILLDEYKNGIWTAEETADLIFKLFRGRAK